ncbi:nitrite/sulfite reductase [uncultured Veillonella sp.]|uniref:nitrite/sulfite reductase n=1 Tax=uncultured Veillonella sp. TaxID=159268 RepID=UPI0025CE274E|nr:nitrite/sulfite reductase [uncultured Veillonella sp.]
MGFLTDEVKARLLKDIDVFAKTSEQFFNKEISIGDYKGLSGPFGTYAERGAKTAMYRLRLPAGRITGAQMNFIADAFDRYEIPQVHFTTGQSIQLHGLQGSIVIDLFKDCHSVGIYSRGGGGDHPRNISASPLRGVTPGEPFDITPYVQVASEYVLTLVPDFKMPRKLKISMTNGLESSTHATIKDLAFRAQADGTFTVYAGGGMGGNSRKGIVLAEGVNPKDILYYIKAMVRTFIENADYHTRSKNRTRYMVAEMGEEKFREVFNKFLTFTRRVEDLSFEVPIVNITKVGSEELSADELAQFGGRVVAQSQKGLYAVLYHPLGGTPERAAFQTLLRYTGSLEAVEGRLTSDESLYFINLTAAEAKEVVKLTPDHMPTDFLMSVSCIGASRCQVGFQNSQGLFQDIVTHLDAEGIDTKHLPKMHISGCPSSCGTHQIGRIGFHGAVKLVDKKPQPAFNLFFGGSDALDDVKFGELLGLVTVVDIPKFIAELATILNTANVEFDTWIESHEEDFRALAAKYI